ncbi:hypothetical protein PGT21_030014 [Puccinia graminis f. sp. tritici]|uniref:DUF833-domain-containing protein n=1 Tax=Puccinia graminis f. sp. tritici TaxID=56615 RepID=A0A5B0R257_PUCGR|nr:hypothetical protein PGT21_030014 [Puccinia graminis f. sp. tritici]
MCIAIWSAKTQLGYRLILASNRDEFLSRPSLPAHLHSFGPIHPDVQAPPSSTAPEDPTTQDCRHIINDGSQDHSSLSDGILSGRDAIAGGSWLGIHKETGRFGFLTNLTPPLNHIPTLDDDDGQDQESEPSVPLISRGLIIQQFLAGNLAVHSYLDHLKSSRLSTKMNGYNLVIGQLARNEDEQDRIGFFCNRNPDRIDHHFADFSSNHHQQASSDPQAPLVYAISNGIACKPPIWPKVTQGIRLMEECLCKIRTDTSCPQGAPTDLETELFDLISTTNDSTDDIPSNILIRPYHRLSTPGASASHETWYGTRTQTIVLVSQAFPATITFVERDAFQIQPPDDPHGNSLGTPVWMGDQRSRWRRFEFQFPAS